MDLQIKQKIALVFGAGSGLGQAIALALAAEGVRVVLAGRTADKLHSTAEQIKGLGGESLVIPWDLAEASVIDQNFSLIESTWGSVDILINNTGGPPTTLAQGQASSLWLEKFQEMVLSVITITDRALPAMKQKKWGRIITTTSSGAISPLRNLAISNTLRASLHAWSKTLSSEVAADGITANIVVPGRIATDRIKSLDQGLAQRQNKTVEEVAQESLKNIPIGRIGEPKEFAAVVTFLASQPASYVTGSVVRVDGGFISSL
jgi:3-oxoacyl-[acyl-carrier protein] reductase